MRKDDQASCKAAVEFLRLAYEPHDWVAIFVKSYDTRQVAQRVVPVSWTLCQRFQNWLSALNARRFNIFVSVNAISPGRRSRTREAIGAVRHVFLDADDAGDSVVSRVNERADLPGVSYLVRTSPNHVHIFWRVEDFDHSSIEALQKQLARELGTDSAATPVTQNTRLPGFVNHKRSEPYLVTADYLRVTARYTPRDFPAVPTPPSWNSASRRSMPPVDLPVLKRARRYLASVPPAIAGQHGDLHTFRVCCRLVRGFALTEDQAIDALSDWNARCQPPWSFDELIDKIRRAQRYGREPVGGLL